MKNVVYKGTGTLFKLMEECFGLEDQNYFFRNEEVPPFVCSALGSSLISVTLTDKIVITASPIQDGHHFDNHLKIFYDKLNAIANDIGTENLSLVYDKDREKVLAVYYQKPTAKQWFFVGEKRMKELLEKVKLEYAGVYNDRTWRGFIGTWNITRLPAIVVWVPINPKKPAFGRYPRWIGYRTIAKWLLLNHIPFSNIREAQRLGKTVRWYTVFKALDHLESAGHLSSEKLTCLENVLFAQIELLATKEEGKC